MNNQFNTLISSYRDNYLQYKVTGQSKFQTAYQSAQQGIQSILDNLSSQVSDEKTKINSFYSEDVEGQMQKLNSKSKFLRGGIVGEKDLTKTAQMRQDQLTTPLPSLSTNQYIVLGVLCAMTAGLMIV